MKVVHTGTYEVNQTWEEKCERGPRFIEPAPAMPETPIRLREDELMT